MKAPEKIYLTTDGDNSFVFTQKRSDNKGIEYIRKDAFIEKACEWLKSNLHDYAGEDDKRNIVPFDSSVFEDFRKAMEGE